MSPKNVLSAIVLSAILAGCSSTPYKIGPVDLAQAGDSATTAYAIYGASGFAESNVLISDIVGDPLGMVGIALLKQGISIAAKSEWAYPEGHAYEGCKNASAVVFGIGAGATVNNILVLATSASVGWVIVPAATVAFLIHRNYLTDMDCGHFS